MASNTRPPVDTPSDPVGKLHSTADELRRDAESKLELQNVQREAQMLRMRQMLQDQQLQPMTVNEVVAHGGTNVRHGFLTRIFQPILGDEDGRPSTVGEVMEALNVASAKLNGMQILRVPPEVHISSASQADPSTMPTDVNVSFVLRELPRFKLETGTDVGNGEGSAYGTLLWRNIFGGAEMLALNAKAGTRTRSAYSANFSSPILGDPGMRVSLEGQALAVEKPWASHEEVVKGGAVRFSWLRPDGDTHSVEYSGAWRLVSGLGANASPTVRADAGDTVKSAIRHSFVRERRDNPHLPQSGYLLKTVLELAGVGPLAGDVGFSKGELEMGGALPVPLPGIQGRTGISIGGGLKLGMLWPLPTGLGLAGGAFPSRINDRFQLGGPTDVRGFKLGGLGPHDGQDSVGGDVFAAGSVNMLLPLPYRSAESGLRLQVFANAGRLVALRNKGKAKGDGSKPSQGMDAATVRRGMVNAVADLLNGTPSMAAGVGLVYAHPVARFELNFSLPLVLRRGEIGTKGVQVGVGINFL